MSLRTCLGRRRPLLTEDPAAAQLLELPTFFLYPGAIDFLLDTDRCAVPSGGARRDLRRSPTGRAGSGPASRRSTTAALAAVERGTSILVVSDAGIGPDRAPIPSLLAARRGARTRLDRRRGANRTRRSSSTPATHATRTPIACLLGYGAEAICPRGHVAHGGGDGRQQQAWGGHLRGVAGQAAAGRRGRRAQDPVEDGDLHRRRVPGHADLRGARPRARGRRGCACAARRRWSAASARPPAAAPTSSPATRQRSARSASLDEPGFIRFRKRGGEYHGNNPDMISLLQSSVGLWIDADDENGDGEKPKRAGRKSDDGRFARLEVAPVEDQGQVIFFEGDRAEPVPPADPADLHAAHLLRTRDHRTGRVELYEQLQDLVEEPAGDRAPRPARARRPRAPDPTRRGRDLGSTRSRVASRPGRCRTARSPPRRRNPRHRDEHGRWSEQLWRGR